MKNFKETQDDRVVTYLEKNGSVDPIDSWMNMGIYRIASNVCRLRKAGHMIETQRKKVFNRLGEPCNVALYVLHTKTTKA